MPIRPSCLLGLHSISPMIIELNHYKPAFRDIPNIGNFVSSKVHMRAYMIPPTKYRMIYSDTKESLELESLSDMTFDHFEEVKLGNFIGRMSKM
ncbi:hypothetical protein H5410_006341 [Solanum commersonii]|uniref:Uncharacterized protein n=1 Tax=Solanum commersonii TaxID=4109 RepID=A0A9J6AA07_SOLCO|nr:hypothetical protein H5410_006341 [Solanum commersonii]